MQSEESETKAEKALHYSADQCGKQACLTIKPDSKQDSRHDSHRKASESSVMCAICAARV